MKRRNHLFIVVIILLVARAVIPFIGGRYTFFLDQLFGPAWHPFLITFFGFSYPGWGGNLPLYAVLSGLASLVGASGVQKLILFGVLILCAVIPYTLFPGEKYVKLYAVLLFLFNPFVYGRFLVGHWLVLWGLAMLPLVLRVFTSYLDKGGLGNLFLTVFALTLLGFTSHLLFASGILLLPLILFKYLDKRNISTIKRAITPLLLFIPLNLYWLGPVIFSEGGRVSTITSLNILAFGPDVNVFNALYSVASMHGFWRGGIIYAKDILPFTRYFYVVILFLAVHGFLSHYKDPERGYVVKALGVTAIIALLLGAGASGPLASVYEWMFHHVPFFRGMRDSQKFVALLVLAYAYLGGLGLQEFTKGLTSPDTRRKYASIAVVVLALATPLIYTFPMLTGFADQVQPTDYPAEWYEVNEFLETHTDGQEQALFLPWHQYMAFSWVPNRDPTIGNPAPHFFSTPVIRGDNVEIGGIYSQSNKPVSHYVEYLFGLGPNNEEKEITNLGELLVPLNVKYVLVTKEVDWQEYDGFLQRQEDLELVLENEYFKVYENRHRVSRCYAVDRVVYVGGWDEYLERSESEDVTRAAYVIDEARAGEVKMFGGGGREVLDVREVNPAKYRVEDAQKPREQLIVFTQRQDTSYPYWTLNGEEPEYQMLGFTPVFKSTDGGVLKYERFYRVYLPSYAVSLLTFTGILSVLAHDYLSTRDLELKDLIQDKFKP